MRHECFISFRCPLVTLLPPCTSNIGVPAEREREREKPGEAARIDRLSRSVPGRPLRAASLSLRRALPRRVFSLPPARSRSLARAGLSDAARAVLHYLVPFPPLLYVIRTYFSRRCAFFRPPCLHTPPRLAAQALPRQGRRGRPPPPPPCPSPFFARNYLSVFFFHPTCYFGNFRTGKIFIPK